MISQFNFITVGSLAWETNINTRLSSLLKASDIYRVKSPIFEQVAGPSINVASGLASMLPSIAICGVTGQDHYAKAIKMEVQRMKINSSYLRFDLQKTPRTINLITSNGEKHVLYDRSSLANYKYPEELFKKIISKTPWVYFSTAEFTDYLLPIAHKMQVKIATDIQAVENISKKHELRLKYSKILFASNAKLKTSVTDFIRRAWQYGSPIVVVTQGANGATLGLKSENKITHYRAFPVKNIVDTTGAGDNFAAAFCASISLGASPEKSLLKGLTFAAKKIQYRGSLNSNMVGGR